VSSAFVTYTVCVARSMATPTEPKPAATVALMPSAPTDGARQVCLDRHSAGRDGRPEHRHGGEQWQENKRGAPAGPLRPPE
jgi:hypothetical protein